jgi:hypothetical protein
MNPGRARLKRSRVRCRFGSCFEPSFDGFVASRSEMAELRRRPGEHPRRADRGDPHCPGRRPGKPDCAQSARSGGRIPAPRKPSDPRSGPGATKAWTALLETGGVKCVPIPAQSPNCNPHAERFCENDPNRMPRSVHHLRRASSASPDRLACRGVGQGDTLQWIDPVSLATSRTFKAFRPSADPPHSLDQPSPLWRDEWNGQVTPIFRFLQKRNDSARHETRQVVLTQ